MATTTASTNPHPEPMTENTRYEEWRKFNDTKIGVKGLVDRGVTTIPAIFVHPNPLHTTENPATSGPGPTIPVIDFASPRSTIVEEVRRAASSFGFFQIINHSVPLSSIQKTLNAIKEFFELPESTRKKYYNEDFRRGYVYQASNDLYRSKAASWRDILEVGVCPISNPEHVPPLCTEALPEWDKEVAKISEQICYILFEGLGLEDGLKKIKEWRFLDGPVMKAHYYPYCPQPELTAGMPSHTDVGLVTLLVQNEVAGLQVKVGEKWVDVEPVEGAIVINIGDMLQILSNDEYISAEHRVVANPLREARVSVSVFFRLGIRRLFGPFPELISAEKPALFRQFTLGDFMNRYWMNDLDGKTLVNYYRV